MVSTFHKAESALNDSATRSQTIWTSFLFFFLSFLLMPTASFSVRFFLLANRSS